MSESNGSNGNGVVVQDQPMQLPTAEEIGAQLTPEQVKQWTAQNMAAEIDAMLQVYTNLSPEDRAKQASMSVNEQFQILSMILPTLTDPDQVRSHPTLIIKMRGPNGVIGQLAAPKLLNGVEDPAHALHSAALLALLMFPSARALLQVHGFHYTFMQSAEDTGRPRIIV